MSLIPCPECSKEISDKAFSCPNCGCPVAAKRQDSKQVAPMVSTKAQDQPGNDKINCATCRSADLRKIDVVWAQGTSSSWNLGTLSFGGSQNELAKKCEPPRKPKKNHLDNVLFVAWMVFLVFIVLLSFIKPILFLFAILNVFFLGINQYYKNNYKAEMIRYNESLTIYLKTWVCMKCGNLSHIENGRTCKVTVN